MARGNRKTCIFDDDDDRRRFLALLAETTERFGIRCYAYCLMYNHYHVVLDTPRGNLSAVMRHINGVYTQASNRRHQRTGHVFEGRFRSIVIDRESYLRRVTRYVVLNPVRGRLVSDAAAWRWSSYRVTAGLEPPPDFVFIDWLRPLFGGDSLQEAQRQFALYVNDPIAHTTEINSGSPLLGPKPFASAVQTLTARSHPDRLLPRHCQALGRPSLQELFENQRSSRAGRNQVLCTAHAVHGYRLAEIAAFLNLHPSTASVIWRQRARP